MISDNQKINYTFSNLFIFAEQKGCTFVYHKEATFQKCICVEHILMRAIKLHVKFE